MARVRPILVVWIGAVLLGTAPAHAMVRYGFDQRYFFDPAATLADHAYVNRDGVWHLFYTRGPAWSNSAGLQDSIGHASTTDFAHWTIYPPVLPAVPPAWDGTAHWAPEIVEPTPGVYYMFFTGVDDSFTQQIGVATSTDLFTWSLAGANPVYHPTSWSSWEPGVWSDCRDPYVLRENGTWYLFVTAKTADGRGAVGAATSADLLNWTDAGPIYAIDPGPTSWHALESTTILPHDNGYALLFGETNVPGTSAMTSDTLTSGWSVNTRSTIDLGSAPAVATDPGTGGQLFSRHTTAGIADTVRYYIKVDSLGWNGTRPVVVFDRPMGAWTTSGSAFEYQPTFLDVRADARGFPAGQVGNGWIATAERWQGPLQLGSPGGWVGDPPTGEARSPVFTISGDSLAFLIGGGNKPDSLAVQLCDACTDQTLFTATGQDDDHLARRVWPLAGWRGQTAYLRILDGAGGAWGHIEVDDIQELLAPGGDSTVAPPPVLSLVAPVTGALLQLDDSTTIRWRVAAGTTPDSVVVQLSRDRGRTFSRVGVAAGRDSTFGWRVTGPSSDSVRVRVIAWSGGHGNGCAQSGDVALQPPSIQNVRVVNLTSTSATVTWTTTVPEVGAVDYGTSAPTLTATESGASVVVHWLVLTSLSPTTTYVFRVRSGSATNDNGGLLFTFRTANGANGSPYVLKGSIAASGASGARTAVVVWLRRAGSQSTAAGALTTAGSTWSLNLANARNAVNGAPFGVQAGDSIIVAAVAGAALTDWAPAATVTGTSPQTLPQVTLVTGVGDDRTPESAFAVLRLDAARPSPGRAGRPVSLRVTLAASAVVSASVMDASGRLVRRLLPPALRGAGAFDLVWDGRDEAGRVVPAGVYLLTARTEVAAVTRRTVLLD